MSYLARLKQLDDVNFSHHTPDVDLPKLPNPSFDSFGSTDTGLYAKRISDNDSQHRYEDGDAPVGALRKLQVLQRQQWEANREKAIGMLEESPDVLRAIHLDDQIDPENMVLFVASRLHQQTCELLIPRAKYDPWRLLELIERLGTLQS